MRLSGANPLDYAGHGYMVRDGIIVVEKDAVIPDGAVV
jgi:hypothetical protein